MAKLSPELVLLLYVVKDAYGAPIEPAPEITDVSTDRFLDLAVANSLGLYASRKLAANYEQAITPAAHEMVTSFNRRAEERLGYVHLAVQDVQSVLSDETLLIKTHRNHPRLGSDNNLRREGSPVAS